MTDHELIYNHTVFHAYFCHLIDIGQVHCAKELCDISWQLEEEINRRSISDFQIEQFVKNTHLEPQDRILVHKYIFLNIIDPKDSQL